MLPKFLWKRKGSTDYEVSERYSERYMEELMRRRRKSPSLSELFTNSMVPSFLVLWAYDLYMFKTIMPLSGKESHWVLFTILFVSNLVGDYVGIRFHKNSKSILVACCFGISVYVFISYASHHHPIVGSGLLAIMGLIELVLTHWDKPGYHMHSTILVVIICGFLLLITWTFEPYFKPYFNRYEESETTSADIVSEYDNELMCLRDDIWKDLSKRERFRVLARVIIDIEAELLDSPYLISLASTTMMWREGDDYQYLYIEEDILRQKPLDIIEYYIRELYCFVKTEGVWSKYIYYYNDAREYAHERVGVYHNLIYGVDEEAADKTIWLSV